jgi:hypothetical protein
MKIDHYQRLRERDAIMRDPNTADNMDVRKALLARVKSGEITLDQCQKELSAIQRNARKNGQQTAYSQAV